MAQDFMVCPKETNFCTNPREVFVLAHSQGVGVQVVVLAPRDSLHQRKVWLPAGALPALLAGGLGMVKVLLVCKAAKLCTGGSAKTTGCSRCPVLPRYIPGTEIKEKTEISRKRVLRAGALSVPPEHGSKEPQEAADSCLASLSLGLLWPLLLKHWHITAPSFLSAFSQGYPLSVSTSSAEATLIVLYPQTDDWFLSLQLLCPKGQG